MRVNSFIQVFSQKDRFLFHLSLLLQTVIQFSCFIHNYSLFIPVCLVLTMISSFRLLLFRENKCFWSDNPFLVIKRCRKERSLVKYLWGTDTSVWTSWCNLPMCGNKCLVGRFLLPSTYRLLLYVHFSFSRILSNKVLVTTISVLKIYVLCPYGFASPCWRKGLPLTENFERFFRWYLHDNHSQNSGRFRNFIYLFSCICALFFVYIRRFDESRHVSSQTFVEQIFLKARFAW